MKDCNVPFYLTGGTALSRAYFNHRYSDDLDFFVNNDLNFIEYVKLVLIKLRENGYRWNTSSGFQSSQRFSRVLLEHDGFNGVLKVDFVNDIEFHYGAMTETNLYYRTDSVRNILSNKLGAMYRYSAKDTVDVVEICNNTSFKWDTIIQEAREKEQGIEITDITQIMKGLPEHEFDSVKWIKKPDWNSFKLKVHIITEDMLYNRGNSLHSHVE